MIDRVHSTDAPAALAMGLRGRAKVEDRYDWRRIGERLEGLYDEVLAEAMGNRV